MGHQLARTALAAALTTIAACGGSGDAGETRPVLDNARDAVAAASGDSGTAASDVTPDVTAGASDPGPADGPDELPPPDPSTFRGAQRFVNLWTSRSGEVTPVDVWVRRTFDAGPVLLAAEVAFGTATPYLATPQGGDVAVVASGAGPDGVALAELPPAPAGEQLTTLVATRDLDGGVAASTVIEQGRDGSIVPPVDGNGLIVVTAANVRAFADVLVPSIGADSFVLGDGAGVCRPQRGEADGFAPVVLDGTQRIELEVPAGPTPVSLHPASGGCDAASVLDVTVDVGAGGTVLVVAFTRDGSGLDAITLPVAAVAGA